MFGGLHVEMTALKAIGKWLEGSGWTSALVQANVASPGTADSFLKATHVSRTRHAHQVTASTLNILMYNAYQEYCERLDEGDDLLEFKAWCLMREAECPQFQYWSITLQFEVTILTFVKSLRERNFRLYIDALTTLMPWFFVLNHSNYASWLPVHIRDMISLKESPPGIFEEFLQGNFVVKKTQWKFSSIPIDHAHEQNNKCVKEDGGAVGLTENTSELLRWMVSGPEIARVISEFESTQEPTKLSADQMEKDVQHHEEVKGVQEAFAKEVKNLCSTIEEMGNPFKESSEGLLVLDTRDILDPSIAVTIKNIVKNGKQQYEKFVEERLEKRCKSILDPIKSNKNYLFSCPPAKIASKEKQQIAALKQNCSLFAQLYVSCQMREGDLNDFF